MSFVGDERDIRGGSETEESPVGDDSTAGADTSQLAMTALRKRIDALVRGEAHLP